MKKGLVVGAAEPVGHPLDLLDLEAGGRAQGVDDILDPGRAPGADDRQLALVVEPANHVEVDHHDRLVERDQRIEEQRIAIDANSDEVIADPKVLGLDDSDPGDFLGTASQ